MAATLHVLAIVLVLSALSSALPFQPVSGIFPYTIGTSVSGDSFSAPTGSHPIAYGTELATQTLRLTGRTNSPAQPSTPSATAANATTSTQDQSSWNSGVISTVVFGCIASILGALAIWATIWLGHRQTKSAARNNIGLSLARESDFRLKRIEIGVPRSRDTSTESTSVPKPAEPPHHPWGIITQDMHAPACGTSVIETPPPAYVPLSVRL